MSDFLDVATLDAAGQSALKRLILSLADTKRLMGIRYSDWTLGAPTVESGIAASSMTQDEWGHCRLLYAMLKEFGLDPKVVEHERDASEYASVSALDTEFPDWAAVVAGIVLVDGALNTALESFSRGSFEPATTRVPKMLAEEEYHSAMGRAWYRRLADSSDEARGLLRDATESMLPVMLAWLGASDEAAQALVAAGVTDPADSQVAAFRDSVRDLVSMIGVDVDAVVPSDDWDSARGRASGHPDDDAIERARGDRNRALLVD